MISNWGTPAEFRGNDFKLGFFQALAFSAVIERESRTWHGANTNDEALNKGV